MKQLNSSCSCEMAKDDDERDGYDEMDARSSEEQFRSLMVDNARISVGSHVIREDVENSTPLIRALPGCEEEGKSSNPPSTLPDCEEEGNAVRPFQ